MKHVIINNSVYHNDLELNDAIYAYDINDNEIMVINNF
jgi:hypothetical protein